MKLCHQSFIATSARRRASEMFEHLVSVKDIRYHERHISLCSMLANHQKVQKTPCEYSVSLVIADGQFAENFFSLVEDQFATTLYVSRWSDTTANIHTL